MNHAVLNPLINYDSLPKFSNIKSSHVIPALETVLSEARKELERLGELEQANWNNFASLIEDIDERISRVWSPVGHLNAVRDNDELREAYQTGISLLTEYSSEVGQNQALYRQYNHIKNSDEFSRLNTAQQKIIDNALLDFKLSGADLDEPKQARLREINQSLSELSNQFERNVLDATQAWQKIVSIDQLDGLPESAISMARQLAQESNQALSENQYLLNLQIPSYLAVMQYANNADLRKEMYLAYSTRASELSDQGKFDNSPLIVDILKLRKEKSQLLGYQHYADYSMVKKMAKSAEHVEGFLSDLVKYAKPVAEKELAELNEFAQSIINKASQDTTTNKLNPWDTSYYSEKLREQRYAFTDEQVKPYFPAPQVFSGMFEIVSRLFAVQLKENTSLQTWHEDVQCFDLVSANGDQLIGQLYVDLYVRKNKRGGAWMDTCIHRRRKADHVQAPVAFLTCNFSPPIGDDSALLTHNEVETLFHEFGHTLHHLLTQVDEMSVAGINGVAWDAVELPSQFLENWCWHEESLKLIAKHYQTGDAIPAQLLNKMRRAKNFQSGMQTLRQVEFSLFDMRLHSLFDPASNTDNVQALLDRVRDDVAVLTPPASNRFQNSFGHIFAGGYAAGYYSYKWSEVLSADAFGRFQEEGIFNAQTGKDFLNAILQRGGVDDPNTLFKEFRGREPKIEPLLQQTGIL